jgi:hypothetical protein
MSFRSSTHVLSVLLLQTSIKRKTLLVSLISQDWIRAFVGYGICHGELLTNPAGQF